LRAHSLGTVLLSMDHHSMSLAASMAR